MPRDHPAVARILQARQLFPADESSPQCWCGHEASDDATKVIEKTTPAMVIIDPAMAPSKELAPSAPPVKFKPRLSVNESVTCVSRVMVTKAKTIAPPAMATGRTQKLERIRFHTLKVCTLATTPSNC